MKLIPHRRQRFAMAAPGSIKLNKPRVAVINERVGLLVDNVGEPAFDINNARVVFVDFESQSSGKSECD